MSLDEFIQLAERLLHLNPNDNHGIRSMLAGTYILQGQPQKTVELAERYPEDAMCDTNLNHLLALYQIDQKGKALTLLAGMAEHFSVAIKMLLQDNPLQPKLSEYRYRIGGKDEAWLYYEEYRHLWLQQGALEWLRLAWRKFK